MSNLAELTSISLDTPEVLDQEFKKLCDSQPNYNWHTRSYVYMHFFTDYWKDVVDKVLDEINLPYIDILFQTHHKELWDEKWYLTVTHTDVYRNSCITIPIYYDNMEPVNFYGPSENDKYPVTASHNPNVPIQKSVYSRKHPSLVNVQTRHNVRILNDSSPRILLQISYKHRYEDIIERNPSIWKFYT